ncbi:uncharacterized protein LOC142661087 [Rhinoderma darwinii]|uniref:uncharacterized protein LOC142661087 n=1 Tax=Rhinoderma darwinii TaxID=43563 RepID=UPI003F665386
MVPVTLPTGENTSFLVDTGAARTVLQTKYVPAELLSPDYIDCEGVEGTSFQLQLTKPMRLNIHDTQSIVSRVLVSPHTPYNLLGTDVLSALGAALDFSSGTPTLTSAIPESLLCKLLSMASMPDTEKAPSTPPLWLADIPEKLWAQDKMDVGVLNVPPVQVNLKPDMQNRPVCIKQYPLSPQQDAAIEKDINSLLENNLIVPIISPFNTPLYPVKKKTLPGQPVQYRMVHDLRAVNAVTIINTPQVPNPHTLLNQVPGTAVYFTVIDLANAFFSIPLDKECQQYFAFTHRGRQYAWVVLPQGAANSPDIFSRTMKDILDTWQPPNQSSVLLQYVDDLLLCSESLENSETDSKSLLMFLEEVGCKASKHKLQLCAKTVVFLGHCISQGMKHVTPDRLEIIQKHPVPRNPKQLRTFLGLIGYCRAWIRDASAMMQPLYDCLTSDPFVLSPEAIDNFHSLKLSLTTRPALGLPDYNKPFTLFCHEQAGHASGVLAQDHGGKMRPLAYYSLALDPIVLGSPTCIRAVSAAAALVDKATDIVLQHDIIVQVPHAVQEMMNTVKTKHLSVARLTKIELTLLSPNVTIKRCVVLNPATLLPLDSEQKEGGVGGKGHGHPLIFQLSTDDELFNFEHEHDCQSLVDMESNGINSIFDVALINPYAEYFVDGSRYWSEDKGHFLTGYAVVHNGKAVIQQSLPSSSSAQEAELKALAEACKLGKGQRVNIYTDSRYAFGVAHDFGTIWRARGFLTSAGKPIKNAKAVEELLESLHMPDQAAIVKVQAHTNNSDLLSKGNEAADAAAKDAAALPLMIVKPVLQPITETLLRAFQDQAPPQEQAEWEERGAAIGLGQLRHLNSKVCLPRALYPMMCALAHGKTHCSKGAMSQLVLQTWHAPGFQNAAAKYTEGCMTCAQHNPGKTTKTPAKHTPKSYYPFQRLQVDYIQLPKIQTFFQVPTHYNLETGW